MSFTPALLIKVGNGENSTGNVTHTHTLNNFIINSTDLMSD